jgi:hypothetical protein
VVCEAHLPYQAEYSNKKLNNDIFMKTKKELKEEFKTMKFRAGIYQIINKLENRIYLQTTFDLDRGFNSDIFQLKGGMHLNKNLQSDWNKLGLESFEFKTFDQLEMKDTATPKEINKELKIFLEMHLTELKKNGQLLY